MKMFCYQCQEAMGNKGCTKVGMCGKTADVAALQDLMIYAVKGLSQLGLKADEIAYKMEGLDRFVIEALFMTITNANFDNDRFFAKIKEALVLRDKLKADLIEKGVDLSDLKDAATFTVNSNDDIVFKSEASEVGVLATENEDVRSLRELIIYGIKGMAAYAEHAMNLGYEDEDISKFIRRAMAATMDDSLTADDLVALTLETGEYGVTTCLLYTSPSLQD